MMDRRTFMRLTGLTTASVALSTATSAPAFAYQEPGTGSAGAKNIMLQYSGYYTGEYEGRTVGDWDAELVRPYVAYLDETGAAVDGFFDGFVLLGLKTPYGGAPIRYRVGGSYTHPGDKTDWDWLLDRYFTADHQIAAIDQAVASVRPELLANGAPNPIVRPLPLFVAIPFPDTACRDFGAITPGGRSLDLASLDDRNAAAKWFIDEARRRFRAARHCHVRLAGFYWMQENLDYNIAGEVENVRYVSDYLSSLDLRFGWIPSSDAYARAVGAQHGFTFTTIQPTLYFSAKEGVPLDTDKLRQVAELADSSDQGIEIQFAEDVLTKPWKLEALYDYLDIGVEMGYMTGSVKTYYEGVYSVHRFFNSGGALGRQVYDDLHRFTVDSYTPAS